MDTALQASFMERWQRFFPKVELPVGYYYTDQARPDDVEDTQQADRCLIGNLERVRRGHAYVYDAHTPGCPGGKRYTGFTQKLRPNFEYFLSCGIPGQLEGERYKKSPELVRQLLESHRPFEAPGRYLVFKRWDRFAEDEEPLVIVFCATPDVLAGLFTLANYDRADPHGVVAPMGSGCSSIIALPLAEIASETPRCVLGMFDVSARPSVPAGTLTFAVPLSRFAAMVDNMEESFLTTASWERVRERLG